MNSQEMGKISNKLRLAFALSSIAFVAALAISPLKDFFREWRHYKRAYVRLAETRPNTKQLLSDFHSGIDQIWLPEAHVVDRCTTCHQGITEPSLSDFSVPQPFRAHSSIPHRPAQWGCVVCHRGQGLATEVKEAHETTLAWEQPLLPGSYLQASCGACHRENIPETPLLNRGRELLVKLNCVGCHRLQGVERPPMIGPDLTNVGAKTSREWLYKWLNEPRTLTDDNGNVTVNGYENESQPRMPHFRLNEKELRALSAYLSALKNKPVEPYRFDPRVVTAWQKRPDLIDQGEVRFRQMFCTTCHPVTVTRGGETKLIGGDIGPELTKVGSKVDPNWLVSWLRDPQAYLPHSIMPRYNWSDEDLYKVTQYIQSKLTDSDLLSNVPKLGSPTDGEIEAGRRLFLDKGCASCHVIRGVKIPSDFGPDLSRLGSKTVSQLMFGNAKIPHTLIAYIRSKITDPASVNANARMPQYHLDPGDLNAVTTALLSMAGEPATPALAKLTVAASHQEFRPAGPFGRLYVKYRCDACHRFNGFGGTLAPDLSFEGSRVRRQWLMDFLKNPQTLRPTLTLRMPQFNMTDEEAATIADYLGMVLQSPAVNPERVDSKKLTPSNANLGKQLYEVKYQCRSCHTIGSSGGYVGPNLSNTGNWMTTAWIQAWLKNPQALVPGTIEPRRHFTDEEIDALTAYLMTLKQKPNARSQAGAATGGAR